MDGSLAKGFARQGLRKDIRALVDGGVMRGKSWRKAYDPLHSLGRRKRKRSAAVAVDQAEGTVLFRSTQMQGGARETIVIDVVAHRLTGPALAFLHPTTRLTTFNCREINEELLVGRSCILEHALVRGIQRADNLYEEVRTELWPSLLLTAAFERIPTLVGRGFVLPVPSGLYLGRVEYVASGRLKHCWFATQDDFHIESEMLSPFGSTLVLKTFISFAQMKPNQLLVWRKLTDLLSTYKETLLSMYVDDLSDNAVVAPPSVQAAREVLEKVEALVGTALWWRTVERGKKRAATGTWAFHSHFFHYYREVASPVAIIAATKLPTGTPWDDSYVQIDLSRLGSPADY